MSKVLTKQVQNKISRYFLKLENYLTKRFRNHYNMEGFFMKLFRGHMNSVKSKISHGDYILFDGSDIQKKYAKVMDSRHTQFQTYLWGLQRGWLYSL